MRTKKLLLNIKRSVSPTPDERVLDRILVEVEKLQPATEPKAFRLRLSRPVVAFALILMLIASTFAVTAAVNQDIRDYLATLFGGHPNPVQGELIGVTTESEGVELTIDAVVAEGDTLFMIYTLKDKDNHLFEKTTSIGSFKAKIGKNQNYGATYNSQIENGEKNHIILYGKDIENRLQDVSFSIQSLRIPDAAKEFNLRVGTAGYTPEGVSSHIIDQIDLADNRLVAQISVIDESKYAINYDMYVLNTKTGKRFSQEAEEMSGETENTPKRIKWYSEKLDGGKAEDYQFIIRFDKVHTFSKPLEANFSVDFGRKPLKVIVPDDVRLGQYRLEKITLNQMSLFATLKKNPTLEASSPKKDLQPIQAFSDEASRDIFKENDDSPMRSRMKICYSDGSEAETLGASATSMGENEYWYYLILNGSLDFSRKPVLVIGETTIPLYE